MTCLSNSIKCPKNNENLIDIHLPAHRHLSHHRLPLHHLQNLHRNPTKISQLPELNYAQKLMYRMMHTWRIKSLGTRLRPLVKMSVPIAINKTVLLRTTLTQTITLTPGARSSKVPVTFQAQSYKLKSKSTERWRSFQPAYQPDMFYQLRILLLSFQNKI